MEYDDVFAQALSSGASWKVSDVARAWIANRLVEVVRNELNKTRIRKLSLQVPDDAASSDFLDGLRWRVCCLVRSQLLRHFDQSIMKWERDAWAHVASLSDPLDRECFRVFVGLDQVVSADAARKAIKYVFHRMHWNLVWEGCYVEFRSDWRFDQIYPRRAALDEAVRARALAARALDALISDNTRQRLADPDVAPWTRAGLQDELERRFAKDGVWGLIHLALDRDRTWFSLDAPSLCDAQTVDLIERQRPRLLVSSMSES
ncbi:hypothetical protein [Brevundimonas pondensis]|uniref:Uncharacterized protein n=1 Tax=Brevundimonas pondensis TaxID=2774189 RepID=A0ABX7SJH7_9CAUL|nr:hypothetical protein [Brevundimonas pondensis]QTC87524.1 hypothetical protein IFE19_15800 [Brevundimonas pondensis]